MRSIRTPLARVRGLGAAKEGLGHWWMQRLTALALVPLSLWFVASVIAVGTNGHEEVVRWMASPTVTVLLVLFIVCVFYHAQLGMQVIVEDYVHVNGLKVTALLLLNFLMLVLGAVCVLAVLRVAFGS